MVAGLNLDLRSVSKFFVVQSDGSETTSETITDEKELINVNDALRIIRDSEAPVKYLYFNYSGDTYKLYPIEDSDEFQVFKAPIMN